MYQCDLSTAIQTTHRDSNRGIDQHQVPDEQGQDIPPGVELAPDGEDPPHIVLPTSPFVHLLQELDMTCDVVVGDVWTLSDIDDQSSHTELKPVGGAYLGCILLIHCPLYTSLTEEMK